ncbi:MAG: SMP-30/gluconolactonase/LRE family protein [Planctomycetota bacterium]|jgi:gluconolactonase
MYRLSLAFVLMAVAGCGGEIVGIVGNGAEVEKLCGGFRFTEGPAMDVKGDIYFTDIPNSRIHKWSLDGECSVFLEDTGRANGLYFDKGGNLLACVGGRGQLVSIDRQGRVTVLADKYQGKKFNSPNDLWIDRKGGIYFTDPRYGNRENMPQDGECVYYLTADRKQVIRVIDDMVRPNGMDKQVFAEQGSDGMTLDRRGNVYLTGKDVAVYSAGGEKIASIEVPESPSNVCFGGKDKKTLFITARTSVYSVRMAVKGL